MTYRYDEPGQKIFFTLGDHKRVAKVYDLRGSLDDPPGLAPILARC